MSPPGPGTALLVQIQTPAGRWVDVGLLKNNYSNNWFEFVPAYWDEPDRPVLGQIFEEHGRSWRPNAHISLPKWFSHLLPEGRLRAAVSQAANVSSVREFELLRRLGPADLQGAVRALPAITEGLTYEVPSPEPSEADQDEDPILKFSLAGAQLKYSVFADGRGLTIPVRGTAGNVIAKLPDWRPGYDAVPQAELGALELARSAGISTATARLISIHEIEGLEQWVEWVGDHPILAVDRFDRGAQDQRIHIEELAQIMNISTAKDNIKYDYTNFETVGTYVANLGGVEQVSEVIDRIVLNTMVGNGDAHLKNWAFQYLDGQNPTLSPAYDIVPTVLYVAKDDLGLNLRGNKAFEAVTAESFDDLARRSDYGISRSRAQVRSAVERVRSNWRILAEYLTEENFSRLDRRLKSLPIVAE